MTATPATALLIELTRQGIDLRADGDKLRFRPRSAMTPDLIERTKTCKPELLVMLRGDRTPQLRQDSQNRPTAVATAPTGVIGRPNAPAGGELSGPPHELSLDDRVESGYVNPGWTPRAWSRRLQQLADRCEGTRPEVAGMYREWATNVENR